MIHDPSKSDGIMQPVSLNNGFKVAFGYGGSRNMNRGSVVTVNAIMSVFWPFIVI